MYHLLIRLFSNDKIIEAKIIQTKEEELMVTPCTDWYLIFTGIAKGNVALGSSILPLNLILQLLLLPVYILLIGKTSVDIDMISLGRGVLISLMIPLIFSIIIRKLLINKMGEEFAHSIGNCCGSFSRQTFDSSCTYYRAFDRVACFIFSY